MIHPLPTTVLLLLANPQERPLRTPASKRIATLLPSRGGRRRKRAAPALEAAAETAATQSVMVAPHGGVPSPRVRSGVAGRLERTRRRRSALTLRRRGDLHLPGSRTDRRWL